MASTNLTGLPIAITGASSGIGRATALACARAGMPVAVGARRIDRLEEVVETISRAGGRAIAVPVDVKLQEQCDELVARTVETFGSIYSVFANAGFAIERPAVPVDDAELRAIWETNYFGTINAVRPALRRMIESRRGHVLICSSCLARLAVPMMAAYSGTKAAQAHLGSALRAELCGSGVRVSTVHPIGTRTEFFDVIRDATATGEAPDHRPPKMFTQSAEYVAGRIVACLRRPRPEVWPGAMAHLTRLGMGICQVFPSLGDLSARFSSPGGRGSHR